MEGVLGGMGSLRSHLMDGTAGVRNSNGETGQAAGNGAAMNLGMHDTLEEHEEASTLQQKAACLA